MPAALLEGLRGLTQSVDSVPREQGPGTPLTGPGRTGDPGSTRPHMTKENDP
ncbi:hypothetical protein GCM10009844_20290 [Nocardioides koreensis]|uniref:Uncharacterized protein n=1 Tax=Nocardioides koreensis TaxID=433651 RepID=A0ABN2ZPJ6_9ACTN